MIYDVVVIASAIPARFTLLRRSLQTWQRSAQRSGLDVAIRLFLEDMDSVDPRYIFDSLGRIAAPNLKVAGRADRSGSHIYGYNHWIAEETAQVYLFTHPDLLFPTDTIDVAYRSATDDRYVAFKTFWMPQAMTEDIDRYCWQYPEVLEGEEALYKFDDHAHGSFYANAGVRDIETWESTTTWAVNHKTLMKLHPFPDFGKQGPDDPYFAGARRRLGIVNHTVRYPILFHQWHPSTWDGDEGDAVNRAYAELVRRFGS